MWPLLLQAVLDNLAVQLGDRVTFRVAIVDHSVKVVQLAILLLRIEAGQVLRCHQMRPQRAALESDLTRGSWGHAYYIRRVVNRAENLKGTVLSLAHPLIVLVYRSELTAIFSAQRGHLILT